jgi:hypothetical protein
MRAGFTVFHQRRPRRSAQASAIETVNQLPELVFNTGARSRRFEPSEFEQTNSARSPVRCALLGSRGAFHKVVLNPLWATCQAASLPTSPPPMMVISVIYVFYHLGEYVILLVGIMQHFTGIIFRTSL